LGPTTKKGQVSSPGTQISRSPLQRSVYIMKECGMSGLPAPDYRLPFEAEVGAHPTFEEMQVAVSRNKLRPGFPDLWKDTNMVLLTGLFF